MEKYIRYLFGLFIVLTLGLELSVYAQSGPGGVGNSTTNKLWLKADAITGVSDAATFSSWIDASGNSVAVTASSWKNEPIFYNTTTSINNLPVVFFQYTVGGKEDFLTTTLSSSTNATVFSIFKHDYITNGAGPIWQMNGAVNGSGFFPQKTDGNQYLFYSDASSLSKATNHVSNIWYSSVVSFGSGYTKLWKDGVINDSINSNSISTGTFQIGRERTGTSSFNGYIAEIIYYNYALNDAERIIVENYLAAKYNLTVANDKYVYQALYGRDVAGIGRTSSTSENTSAQSAGILKISNASSLDDNDFLFFGHDNGDITTWTTTETPNLGVNINRLAREWRLDETNNIGSISVSIDTTLLPAKAAGYTNYVVWIDADGNFSSGAVRYPMTLSGGEYVANGVEIQTSDYIAIGVFKPEVQFSVVSGSGAESTSSFIVTANLNYTLASNLDINLSLSGTATGSGTDYTTTGNTITILAGQTSANYVVNIVNDLGTESDETIIIDMISATGGVNIGTNSQYVYTIIDDESSREIQFQTTSSSNSEAQTSVNLVIGINQVDNINPTSVNYSVTGGTATGSGIDYTLASGTAIVNAGSTTTNINIAINNDVYNESNETIIVTISNSSNAVLGTNTQHTYTIMNDDAIPTVQFTSSAQSASETKTNVSLNLVLASETEQDVTVDYTVVGGIAIGGGVDYTLASGTATISAGMTTTTIDFTVVNEVVLEEDETVEIQLSNPSTNASLGTNSLMTYSINDDDNPRKIQFTLASLSALENIGSYEVEISANIVDLVNGTSVNYSVTGGTAIGNGTDYTLASGTAVISIGDSTTTFSITITNESVFESDETVIITLSSPVNANIGVNNQLTFTIENDDSAPSVQFQSATSNGSETVSNPSILVNLSSATGTSVTVDYSVTGGTATGNGTDYTLNSGTLTFLAGETQKTINPIIVNDINVESAETIICELSNPTAGLNLGATTTNTYTITDDDNLRTIGYTASSSSTNESSSSINILVQLNNVDNINSTTVDYSVTGGTATGNGADYTLASGTATIIAGSNSANINVSIVNDLYDETNETIIITLSNPLNAKLGTITTYTLTILDDDNKPTVQFSSASSNNVEGQAYISIPVILSAAAENSITVDYTILGGTATLGVDFTSSNGTLTFSAGETSKNINITVTNDAIIEANETLNLTLTNPSSNATLGTNYSHVFTIMDDDNVGCEGPGGVGLSTNNKLWLIANDNTISPITTWTDNSGNGNDATSIAQIKYKPLYVTNVINGYGVARFDGIQQFFGSVFSVPHNNFTVITVFKNDNTGGDGPVWQADQSVNSSGFFPEKADGKEYLYTGTTSSLSQATTFTNGTWRISSSVYGFNFAGLYNNGTVSQSGTTNNITYGSFQIGRENSGTTHFKGDIAEIICYTITLNTAQRCIVENYLASKYALTISNDKFVYDVTHPYDVAGIGKDDELNLHPEAKSAGILKINNPSSFDVGDYLLFGHDNADITTWSTTEAPNLGVNTQRIAREWKVNETGDVGVIHIMFDASKLPSLPIGYSNYVIWIDDDGDFSSGAVQYPAVLADGYYTVEDAEIADGNYIAIGIIKPIIQFSLVNDNGTEMNITKNIEVSMNYALANEVSVNYTISGTAISGVDYILSEGTVLIAAGDVSANIDLELINDTEVESDETIVISLTNPSVGLSIGAVATHTYTLNDDDVYREIGFGTVSGSAFENETKPEYWAWANKISGTGNIYPRSLALDPDNNLLVFAIFDGTISVGGVNLSSTGGNDMLLAKFSSTGDVLWAKKAGSTGNEDPMSVKVDSNGDIYITGGFRNTAYFDAESIVSLDAQDVFLAKYDSDGNIIWAKNIGSGPNGDRAEGMVIDNQNIIIAGIVKEALYFDSDTIYAQKSLLNNFIAKLDSIGNLIWVTQFVGTNASTKLNKIEKCSDGGYFIGGCYLDSLYVNGEGYLSNGDKDMVIIKVDKNGQVEWTRTGGGTGEDIWASLSADFSGNIYSVGSIFNNGIVGGQSITTVGDFDIIVAKYDNNGNKLWLKNFGGLGADRGQGINVLGNTIHFTGYFSDTLTYGTTSLSTGSLINNDVFVGLLDAGGNEIYAKQISGVDSDKGSEIIISNDGNVYLSGYYNSDTLYVKDTKLVNAGNNDCFIAKYKYATAIPITINSVDYDNVTTVNYSISGGNATSGVDYTLSSGEISIQNGTLSSTINLILIDDYIEEGDENIQITLSSPQNSVLGTNTSFDFTILDNDTKPTIEFEDSIDVEYESALHYYVKVVLSGEYAEDVEVNYSVIGGTAIGSGDDYILSDGTLIIPADSTYGYIEIELVSDDVEESDETIIISMTNPVNSYLGDKTEFILTIYDTPSLPTAYGGCIYGQGEILLTAESPTGVCTWYDAIEGGNLLNTGNSYTTPYLTSTENYYVSSANLETSLDFGETGDYVFIPNSSSVDMDGNLTIEMKVKVSDFSVRQYLVDKYYGGEGRISIETAGYLKFYYGDCKTYCSSYESFASIQTIPLNEWVHIALVRDVDNSLLSWYFNGILIRQVRANYSGVATNNDIYIGRFFNGEMDEVRIWNKARKQSEIISDKDKILLGSETGLVLYYNMNNGHGLVLEDITSNNYDANLIYMDSTFVWNAGDIINESVRIEVPAIVNPPINILGEDISVEEAAVLDAGVGYTSYLWNDSSSTQTLDVVSSGEYWVSVLDEDCVIMDTIHVEIRPSLPTVSDVCKNSSGEITLYSNSSTGISAWYDTEISEDILSYGEVYRTSYLDNTTSYYVTSANVESSLNFEYPLQNILVANSSNIDMDGNLSIEFKIKVLNMGTRIYIIDKSYQSEGRISIEQDGSLKFYYGDCDLACTSYESFSSIQSIPQNEWVHVALVRDVDNSRLSWYFNGVLIRQAYANYTGHSSSNDLKIGANLIGEIDEIRIWNIARTQSEINESKDNVLIGIEPGLELYYSMNNGHGLIVNDNSNNEYNGTLINMDSTSVWKHNSIINESSRVQAQAIIGLNPVELGNDTIVDSLIVLDATDEYVSYLWNNSSTSQTLNVTSTGQYWVSVVDGSGCYDIDTISVTVNSAKNLILTDVELNTIEKASYQFENFDAKLNGDVIDLSWLIENELNTYYYTIEKTIDLENFETLDIIFAGENTSLVDYFIFDDNPHDGISYYRLKQTDLYGKSVYSDLIRVEYGQDSKQIIFKIYPNPVQVNHEFYVNMSGLESDQEVLVVVIDALGREMYSKVIFTNSDGTVLEAIDPHGRLDQGTYFIIGSTNNKVYSKKLIIR